MNDINKINAVFGTKLGSAEDKATPAKPKVVSKAKAHTRVTDAKRDLRELQYNNAELNKKQTKKQGG